MQQYFTVHHTAMPLASHMLRQLKSSSNNSTDSKKELLVTQTMSFTHQCNITLPLSYCTQNSTVQHCMVRVFCQLLLPGRSCLGPTGSSSISPGRHCALNGVPQSWLRALLQDALRHAHHAGYEPVAQHCRVGPQHCGGVPQHSPADEEGGPPKDSASALLSRTWSPHAASSSQLMWRRARSSRFNDAPVCTTGPVLLTEDFNRPQWNTFCASCLHITEPR